MNGAELLARRLVAHGVDTVFGLPGEENLAVVEALSATPIELVITRHEQHAAFMAATHGRLTGRPGVCLATLGPGAGGSAPETRSPALVTRSRVVLTVGRNGATR